MKEIQIVAEELRSLLHYEKDTGVFTRIESRGSAKAGSVAGSLYADGYIYIAINRRRFLAHRLAWLYMTGSFPEKELDHIDRNRCNNAWNNLREVSTQQNSFNRSLHSNNKTGFKGVSFCKREQKFRAMITMDGKLLHLGYFSSAQEASLCYQKFALAMHGEYSDAYVRALIKQREEAA